MAANGTPAQEVAEPLRTVGGVVDAEEEGGETEEVGPSAPGLEVLTGGKGPGGRFFKFPAGSYIREGLSDQFEFKIGFITRGNKRLMDIEVRFVCLFAPICRWC